MLRMPVHKDSHNNVPLFQGGSVERNLVVVVDADTVTNESDAITMDGLLRGFLADPTIESYQYADDGPPAGTEMSTAPFWEPSPVGWLIAPLAPANAMTSHGVIFTNSTTRNHRAIHKNQVPAVTGMLARTYTDADQATLERDALLLLAASEMRADILVTNRARLLGSRPVNTPERIAVLSTAETLGTVGLYLRARGKYYGTRTPRISITYNRGNFWDSAVRLYMPDYFDVASRAQILDQSRGTDGLVMFAFSSMRRAARALERRDAAWRHINQKQDRDVAEDTLAIVESMLLFLMGSVDVAAKLTNGIYELNVPGGNAAIGWQKKDWRRALAPSAPTVEAILAPKTTGEATLDALRLLRNTIHDVGLEAATVQASNREQLTWMSLPNADRDQILASIDRLGGRDKWGIHAIGDDRTFIEIGPLVENLTSSVLSLLGDVYRVLDLDLVNITTAPPPAPRPTVNEALLELHIQWQLSLDEPWPNQVSDETAPTTS